MAERLPSKKENVEGGEAFFENMQNGERDAAKGVLSTIDKIPKGLRKGILMLAAAGTILSATEASAYHDSRHRNTSEWDRVIGVAAQVAIEEVIRQKNPYENRRYESSREYRMQAEALRQKAYQEYHASIQRTESYFRQEMNRLDNTHLPPYEKARARNQLIAQRNDGIGAAREDFAMKMRQAGESERYANEIDRGNRR